MKADITRDTFDPHNHFSRVLHQQGRVTLDADQNEQAAILLHYLRTLARDLIGPYAAPADGGGFDLSFNSDGQLMIGAGRFYVDGILAENGQACAYTQQPDYPLASDDPLLRELRKHSGNTFWLYLDVWERHITAIEQDAIRESALGGPDTCTRAKVVWQVKALPIKQGARGSRPSCAAPLSQLTPSSNAKLAARVDPGQQEKGPCTTAPDAKYRGLENQLYRVEIHRGGAAGAATFKWSRDNGSTATAWIGTEGYDLQVANTRGFEAGNWVELSNETLELQGKAGVLVRLAKVDNGVLTVDPSSVSAPDALAWSELLVKPSLRRWDQVQNGDVILKDGTVPVKEGSANDPGWLVLEDGVQIRFDTGGTYLVGDYWQFAARVATGSLEWPLDSAGQPALLASRGIEHHYAPLGFISWNGSQFQVDSCRCTFAASRNCP